jgi:putative ABC transport system ATP-binding protein
MALMTVKGLKKDIFTGSEYFTLLDDVNLEIKEKEYVAIMGKSGSGKSTLLGIMAGLDNASAGSVKINGEEITGLNENELSDFRNRNIGIVFQAYNLIPTLTALENIEVPLYFSRVKINITKRARTLLKRVGLADKADRLPRQLSGGEQQRIAVARALVTIPRILFADEPTGSLDSQSGKAVLEIIKDFINEYEMAVVLVTHDKMIAGESERILYLENGRLN